MNQLIVLDTISTPALVVAAGDRAGVRFLEFFASAIRNPHTRRSYARAAGDFFAWCGGAGVPSITAVQPLHVAAWIELQTQTHSAPAVKQQLAAMANHASTRTTQFYDRRHGDISLDEVERIRL